jgi:CHAD domain-containing protein
MTLDLEKAAKPLRKLRKLLKEFGPEPSPEEVHKLRTSTRKLEATLHAVPEDGGKTGRRALKSLKPVRKLAGRVRDMDVLIAKAAPLCKGPDCEGLVMLLEELARKRARSARKLQGLVDNRRRNARKALKAAIEEVDRAANSPIAAADKVPARPQILATQLEHWPKLHKDNLHEFRKGVKELGYMLQVLDGADERKIASFAQVKDSVGEWHDWLELQHAAQEVFGKEDNPILNEIRRQTHTRLREAMTAANSLRKNGFSLGMAA